MNITTKQNEEMKGTTGLLVSILARYPEVGTVTYDPLKRIIKFSFLLQEEVEIKRMEACTSLMQEALLTFHKLEYRQPDVLFVKYENNVPLASLYIHRDVESLSLHEIALIVELLKQQVGSICFLEKELNDTLHEDEILWQEEMISSLLEDLRGIESTQSLYAFREEGRVMVFNC
ncbi:hypothetical protein [Heliorestis convoluta]|uniref:hypothetical protein n=1 Tax=Heliorestis convoluta TaxID=356322 RepID=UPI00129AB2A1|nr:hypothetical protein [Heliorestis convoluta]